MKKKISPSLICNLMSSICLIHLSCICICLSSKLYVKSILGKQKQNEKLKIKQTMMHCWGCESPKPLLDTIVFFCEMKSSIYFFLQWCIVLKNLWVRSWIFFFKIQANQFTSKNECIIFPFRSTVFGNKLQTFYYRIQTKQHTVYFI